MKNLGEKIWRLREARGLSQEALAEMLAVSRQTISNWENDKATPDAYKLKQLCEALGVRVDDLLETGDDTALEEKNSKLPEEDGGLAGRKRDRGRGLRILLLSVLGVIAALLLAVAIVLFTLPKEEKTQAITSVITLTPAMGGIFLLGLAALVLVAAAVLLSKRK